jgi:hypothetical protein
MQPIYTQTVGAGGASSIVFNNIPQGYTDLYVLISAREASATNPNGQGVQVTFNNDPYPGALQYSNTVMYGDGSSTASYRDIGAAYVRAGYLSTNVQTANTFGSTDIYISNYSSGLFKSTYGSGGAETNGAAIYMMLTAGLYRDTRPITSIKFTTVTNLAPNTTITIYGIGQKYAGGTPVAPTIGSVTDQAGFVSVAFIPATNDQSSSYAVTSVPAGSTTYGASSPIVIPTAVDTSYVYQVSSVNDRGTSASANSSSITTFNSYASIATYTVTSGTATTFTFNNIPQQYKHLELRCIARSGTGTSTQIDMNFNNDAGNNYTFHQFYGTASGPGTSATSTGRSNYPDAVLATLNSGNQSGVSILKIQDYSAITKNKTVFQLYGFDFVGTGTVQFTSGMWMSLSPITSITFTARTQNIGNFTQIALYGIA